MKKKDGRRNSFESNYFAGDNNRVRTGSGYSRRYGIGVLIEQNRIPLNAIVNGRAVSADNLPDKIRIDKTTSISVVGPSKENLNEVESNWKQDMVARNYSFRVSDKIKLMEAFEYQMERIKNLFK